MLFSDQVSILSNWFKNWNECEQTVALYSLLKKVQKSQAKFLARCLEHGLRDCVELGPIEEKANDADFISGLLLVSDQEKVISILLTHLPLLKPGNDFVKSQYLKLLPKVLEFSVERSQFLQESRQLLSYSLIHPAFDNDERTSLTSWMEHLDDRLVPENASKNGEENEANKDVNGNRLWKDDPALIPPSERSPVPAPWQPSEVNSGASKSLSPVHRRDDYELTNSIDNAKPSEETAVVEIDFNPWLKSLRLHKYTGFFNSMTYDEVMGLTEDKLALQNVTKGARDKILLNIKKLHERFDRLQALEKEIGGGGSIRNALSELKGMICTPIMPSEASPEPIVDPKDPTPAEAMNMNPTSASASKNEVKIGDIPAQFTKVLGKACTQLLISRPDKDNISVYMSLLEKCMQHKAFTPQLNKRLSSWKNQISKIQRTLPRNQQMSSQRSSIGSTYASRRVTGRSLPSFGARVTSPIASPSPLSGASAPIGPAGLVKSNWYGSGFGSNTQPTPNSVQQPVDVARKTASLDPSFVRRTTGFLLLQNNDHSQSRAAGQVEQDITRRLDSLGLSVTDQALPGQR